MPTLSAEKQDYDSSWFTDDEEFEQVNKSSFAFINNCILLNNNIFLF